MSTPTDKPIDRVSLSLSDADFKRVVAKAIGDLIFRADYKGRIEVLEILPYSDDEREGWQLECLFIPEDAT